jgi:hypothetical protein
MGWDGMGWDGMGWDGTGWDGMGRDGMGLSGMGLGEVGRATTVLLAASLSPDGALFPSIFIRRVSISAYDWQEAHASQGGL